MAFRRFGRYELFDECSMEEAEQIIKADKDDFISQIKYVNIPYKFVTSEIIIKVGPDKGMVSVGWKILIEIEDIDFGKLKSEMVHELKE